MTNSELIRDALGLLGVINESESPSPEQGAHGLRVQNQMMEQWEEDGIKLQYFAQTDITANFPCAPYTEAGVTAHLAIRLAPSYGATVSSELAAQADMGFSTILRKAVNAKLPVSDMSHMPQGEGKALRYNILTDH
jgi:hypothetical protein